MKKNILSAITLVCFTTETFALGPILDVSSIGQSALNKWQFQLLLDSKTNEPNCSAFYVSQEKAGQPLITLQIDFPKNRTQIPAMKILNIDTTKSLDIKAAHILFDNTQIEGTNSHLLTLTNLEKQKNLLLVPRKLPQALAKLTNSAATKLTVAVQVKGQKNALKKSFSLSGLKKVLGTVRECLGIAANKSLLTDDQAKLLSITLDETKVKREVVIDANNLLTNENLEKNNSEISENLSNLNVSILKINKESLELSKMKKDEIYIAAKTSQNANALTISDNSRRIEKMNSDEAFLKNAPQLIEQSKNRISILRSEKISLQNSANSLTARIAPIENNLRKLQEPIDQFAATHKISTKNEAELRRKKSSHMSILGIQSTSEINSKSQRLMNELSDADAEMNIARLLKSKYHNDDTDFDREDEDFEIAKNIRRQIREGVESSFGIRFREVMIKLQKLNRLMDIEQDMIDHLTVEIPKVDNVEKELEAAKTAIEGANGYSAQINKLKSATPTDLIKMHEQDIAHSATAIANLKAKITEVQNKKCRWYFGCSSDSKAREIRGLEALVAAQESRVATLAPRVAALKSSNQDPGLDKDLADLNQNLSKLKTNIIQNLANAKAIRSTIRFNEQAPQRDRNNRNDTGRGDRNQNGRGQINQGEGRQSMRGLMGANGQLISRFESCQFSEQQLCLDVVDQLGKQLTLVVEQTKENVDRQSRAVADYRNVMVQMRNSVATQIANFIDRAEKRFSGVKEKIDLLNELNKIVNLLILVEKKNDFIESSGLNQLESERAQIQGSISNMIKQEVSEQSRLSELERNSSRIASEVGTYEQKRASLSSTSANLADANAAIQLKIAAHDELIAKISTDLELLKGSIDSDIQKYFARIDWFNYYLKLTK